METYMADKLFPEWKLWEQFASGSRQRALRDDSLIHTHPIITPIRHPDEIPVDTTRFRMKKSACCIVMLHSWLGDARFRQGIRTISRLMLLALLRQLICGILSRTIHATWQHSCRPGRLCQAIL